MINESDFISERIFVNTSICVVGCGEQASKILDQSLPVLKDLTLYFASENEEDSCRYNSHYSGAGIFNSIEDAVAEPLVDAVYLSTPHHLHLKHTILAARHGKHVLVEKPIATKFSDAEIMISAAKDSNVVLMVSEPERYLPTVDKCKKLISEGEIGNLRLVHVQNQHYDRPVGWRTDMNLSGGGELIDGGMHSIDILLNIGGLPNKIYAVLPKKLFSEVDGDDGAVAIAHLPDGAIGLLNHSSSTPVNNDEIWVMVTGTKGQIRFQPESSNITLDTIEETRTIRVSSENSVRRMMKEFISCIDSNSSPEMTGVEGAYDLAVALASYQSAELGIEVELTYNRSYKVQSDKRLQL